jgi:hypothetical protein
VNFLAGEDNSQFSQRQRWSMYLTLSVSLLAFLLGLIFRNSLLYATTTYINREVGLEANYPENWLIDSDGEYVFRVRDVSRLGFKTTIQVAIHPVSSRSGAVARSVFDALTLARSQVLGRYDVQSTGQMTLPGGIQAITMSYSYVATDSDTFLVGVPVVVQGIDVLVIRRDQAIVITFLSDVFSYGQDFSLFERFLQDLRFS